MRSAALPGRAAVVGVTALMLLASPASAQERVGGHFGTVVPLVTRADGGTTTVSDDFVIGFPTITIRTSPRWASISRSFRPFRTNRSTSTSQCLRA